MLRRIFSIKNRVDVLTLLCQYFESIGYTLWCFVNRDKKAVPKKEGDNSIIIIVIQVTMLSH